MSNIRKNEVPQLIRRKNEFIIDTILYVKYLISCEVYKIRKLHKGKLEDSIVSESNSNYNTYKYTNSKIIITIKKYFKKGTI